MIRRLKAFAKRHWPALRLRTILFMVLLFAAAMPGVGAIGLRVYENSLVRQTEAELIAQGAALAAITQAAWPGAVNRRPPPSAKAVYRPESTTVDLNAPILPERPPPDWRPGVVADPAATRAAAVVDPIFRQTSVTTLASLILLDRRGVIVRGQPVGASYAAVPEVSAALSGVTRTTLRHNGDYRPRYSMEWLSRASGLRIHHARPVIVEGRVVGVLLLSRSPRALFRGIYEDRGKIVLGIVVIFGVLLVLAGLVSRGVARPIEALSAASRGVTAGRGSVPETPATAAIEIRTLYEDFRVMSDAIERRSRYLRDFAAAVSHEFKTPLAGIRGAVELLEDHLDAMSNEERRRFLANIAADAARLSQLVTRLLDLARADMANPQVPAGVDLAPSVRRVADAMRGPDLTIEVDIADRLHGVAVPEATIESVLATLLENSRQANARRVEVSAVPTSGAVALIVQDDGAGIPASDRERVFEPFFTSRRSEGGTGLGLAIARSLLAASHGTIEVGDSAAGTRFECVLPTDLNRTA